MSIQYTYSERTKKNLQGRHNEHSFIQDNSTTCEET